MIKEILYKLFGVNPQDFNVCPTCEVLRVQLDEAVRERRELLQTILERSEPPKSEPMPMGELKPVRPRHIPWSVRQQLLEAEDRVTAQKLREKTEELDRISELEKELGVKDA